MSFLGHVVSQNGISCDPAKIEAVRSWGHPTTVTELLISAPILAYPHETGMFVLDTDASNTCIGASGEERVVAYASKALSASQHRYRTTMRELLGIVRFCEHFRHYLLGRQFLLRTDHKALLWLHKFKDPDGMQARWITALTTFDYEVQHRPGAKHANADGISHRTCACPDCPDCVSESEDDSDPIDGQNGQ